MTWNDGALQPAAGSEKKDASTDHPLSPVRKMAILNTGKAP